MTKIQPGMVFGKWTVVSRDGSNSWGTPRWCCRCECGRVKSVLNNSLLIGRSTNCGCGFVTHGMTIGGELPKEYSIWSGVKRRCFDDRRKAFKDYGGRGVTMCSRWAESFAEFLKDMGPIPSEKHSIERIDNNGNYEPSNCRWMLRSEQQKNKRTNVMLKHEGKTQHMAEWAREKGIAPGLLQMRIQQQHWPVALALETPAVRGRNQTFRFGKAVCVSLLLLCCASCALGGAQVTREVVFVEPGGVCEIATDNQLPIVTKPVGGSKAVSKKNLAGFIAVPKSVYRQLRDEWLKNHPDVKEAEKPDS